MMAADYRHIDGLENRLGRHYSRFPPFSPTPALADQSLALRKLCDAGSNRRSRARPRLGCRALGRLGGNRARHLRGRQGPHQDRLEVGDQGDLRRRERPIVQMGGLVHRLEERDEGLWLFRRRAAAADGRFKPALWLMALMLAGVLVGVLTSLPRALG